MAFKSLCTMPRSWRYTTLGSSYATTKRGTDEAVTNNAFRKRKVPRHVALYGILNQTMQDDITYANTELFIRDTEGLPVCTSPMQT